MAVAEMSLGCRVLSRYSLVVLYQGALPLFVLYEVKLPEDFLDHELWADRALVGEIQAEVRRSLPDLLFHVSGLLQDLNDQRR